MNSRNMYIIPYKNTVFLGTECAVTVGRVVGLWEMVDNKIY